MSGVTPASTNGVNLIINGNFIIYTNSPNVNDLITYSVGDGRGGTNAGAINITINPFVSGQQTAQMHVSSNSALVKFAAIPGYTYTTQRNTNLAAGLGWISISTNTASTTNGGINATDHFTDLGGTPPASAYYRLLWHP